ncbi:MAG: diguanylate cyclase domain-containing protein [Candidatus Acidiferrales bacterium]
MEHENPPSPPTLQPASETRLREIRAGLEKLERRGWWLWAAMVVVVLLLTGGLASFSLPSLFPRTDPAQQFEISIAIRGLLGLVLLFSTYTIYQQMLNRRLRQQVADQIGALTQLQVRAEEFHQLAMLDPLTGLYNRRVCEEHLTAEISRATRHDYPLTVLALDLDGLKDANDKFGHAAGDLVLKAFASRLKKAVRSSDLPARMGGDEFLTVLPECDPELVPRVLARLTGLEVEYSGSKIPVPFSAGWVGYQAGERPDQLLERADHALYSNKRTGKVEEEISRAQAEIRQSQKMETVGRMAGSVAHDFNNLLMLIKGYSELMTDQLPPDSPQRKNVGEIQKAAERAAGLTRQLLAFARNQALEPKVLEVNPLIQDFESMLRRLVGAEILLVFEAGSVQGRIKADPGQIEQIVLNLVVNARDAMPNGGTVKIRTADATLDPLFVAQHPGSRPGSYVLLQVADSGVGIDEETKAHIFQPFFTTKEKGKGTGLGLTTVYGIVKQCGGYIGVDSEPGHGTIFSVYFPRLEAEALPAPVPAAAAAATDGVRTVLVVEDELALRELARQFLTSNGYRVLEAGSGQEALNLADSDAGAIHLLLTDVMMPGMTGWELAKRIRIRHPEVRVVYMSGYADDDAVRQGLLDPSVDFLQKPFTLEMLSQKLRDVLESPAKA